MSSANETIRIALLALVAGVALPLAVQLYLTARAVRRAVEGLEPRLDRTLADLNRVTAELRQGQGPGSATTALIAALAPALLAAARAFRGTIVPASGADASPNHNPSQEKSP